MEDLRRMEEWMLEKGPEMGVDLKGVTVGGASAGKFSESFEIIEWKINASDLWFEGVYVAALAAGSWERVKPKTLLSFYGMIY